MTKLIKVSPAKSKEERKKFSKTQDLLREAIDFGEKETLRKRKAKLYVVLTHLITFGIGFAVSLLFFA